MPSALIIVDVQNDFCAGGALAVPDADAVVPRINKLRDTLKPDLVVLTQDWHPTTHTSFITNNPGETLFKPRTAPDADGNHQMMWPQHCVQYTPGAEFHPALQRDEDDIVIRKGKRPTVDSYSGFGSEPLKRREPCVEAFGSERRELTDLEDILEASGVREAYVVGLAFDYCVAATAKDAAAAGYKTFVIRSATRAVAPESASKAMAELIAAGVTILEDMVTLPVEPVPITERDALTAVIVKHLDGLPVEKLLRVESLLDRLGRPKRSIWARLFCRV